MIVAPSAHKHEEKGFPLSFNHVYNNPKNAHTYLFEEKSGVCPESSAGRKCDLLFQLSLAHPHLRPRAVDGYACRRNRGQVASLFASGQSSSYPVALSAANAVVVDG
jgi:hypothetical protein